MATTATKTFEVPIGPIRMQGWRIVAGASDTSATWKTGLFNVNTAQSTSQDDSSHGLVINSSDGTENTAKGDVYLAGVINSAILEVLVFGS